MSQTLGEMLPSIKSAPPGPHSLELAGRLHAVESRNVTWLSEDFPVFWDRALGSNVIDVDGNVYVDLTSAFGVAFAGHSHPSITLAIEKQGKVLVHGMGDVHPSASKVKIMEELGELSPWKEARTVLASSGTEAMEVALKTAQMYSGKTGLIAFRGAYHGLTLGSLSVTDREKFRDPFVGRLSEHTSFVNFPKTGEEAEAIITEIASIVRRKKSTAEPVGAIVIEPIQGRGGVQIPPEDFLQTLSDFSQSAGLLLIFDEIFSGLGRSGVIFETERAGVVPDLVCLGKALGGGMPLSACIGSREVMAGWPETDGEAIHTSTFLGHPLSCAAGISFLNVLKSENLVLQSVQKGQYLLDSLQASLRAGEHVFQVRGRGLLIGIELHNQKNYSVKSMGSHVSQLALKEGLIVLPAGIHGEVVELAPPATITREQMDFAVKCLSKILLESQL